MDDAAESELRLSKIGQIAIPVTDVDRAIAFYRDVLGMQFLFRAPPGLGFFDCSGVRLMLDGSAAEQAGHSSVVYYEVSDLDHSFEILRTHGVEFEADPHMVAKLPDHELWMAFFRDPDSNLIALMSEVRP